MTDPHPGIPPRAQMPELLLLARGGSDLAGARWLRGAVYWHCRTRRMLGLLPPAFTEGEALHAARTAVPDGAVVAMREE